MQRLQWAFKRQPTVLELIHQYPGAALQTMNKQRCSPSSTWFSSTKEELCCQNLWETIIGQFYRDSVLLEVNNVYQKAQPNTGMREIKPLHYNTPAHKLHLVTRVFCKGDHWNFATCLTSLPGTFAFSHSWRNASLEEVSSPGQPSEPMFPTVWRIYPKKPTDQHFYNGLDNWRNVWQ